MGKSRHTPPPAGAGQRRIQRQLLTLTIDGRVPGMTWAPAGSPLHELALANRLKTELRRCDVANDAGLKKALS